ncbi:hypothetical protein B0H13DRAFT_2430566 [Mycena leptocephala]|nr:hypothetical protein B0H13DRAFT_2430566 [Mycena leptocephala]
MASLPPELIRGIVDEVHDARSLKMCALVATVFREASQRNLFRSLSVGGDSDNYKACTAILNLLRDAPHLIPYFRRLSCRLPGVDVASENVRALCAVLDHLSTVHTCYFMGRAENPARDRWDHLTWPTIPPQLALAIATFIQRQKLSELHIISIGALPRDVLTLFLGAARTLSLIETSLDPTAAATVEGLPSSLALQNLCIFHYTDIATVLTSCRFLPYLKEIRKLWVDHAVEALDVLASAVSRKLVHLRLQCLEPAQSTIPLPRLPCLESVEILLDFQERDAPWFPAYLLSVLSAAPDTLKEICITFDSDDSSPLVRSLAPATMIAIERAITDSTCSPRIRWRLDVIGKEASFAEFVTNGKLTIEPYTLSGEARDLSFWATDPRFSE